jgi:hypothetical protein
MSFCRFISSARAGFVMIRMYVYRNGLRNIRMTIAISTETLNDSQFQAFR